MPSEHVTNLQKAMAHLSANDPHLAPVIAKVGAPTFEPHTDYYWELVDAIISQQLSIKAARTIEQRFLALFGGKIPEPHQILEKSIDELRSVGLSRAKASYVQDLATRIKEGKLKIESLPHLPNDEIIAELVAVKGIGEWTAHMFMMFALGRLDVLPVGDLGIKNGFRKVYGLDSTPTTADMQALAAKYNWHPYESVASWYLWQALELKDD
jgi:DNA-3-methyladenine glycosylase II